MQHSRCGSDFVELPTSKFWQSDFFLIIGNWRFPDFLFIVSGPIVLLFATHTLLAEAALIDDDAVGSEDALVSRRFLACAVVMQGWSAAVTVLYGGGLTPANSTELALAVILIAMYVFVRPVVHAVGTIAVAIAYVTALSLLGIGVLS